MEIRQAVFVSSRDDVRKCPPAEKPEFAFIGRSNVGKSSLINLMTRRKGLAKISSKPGKTQTINHYLINDSWYLVDLPGYGYASVGKAQKKEWPEMIEKYLLARKSLFCLFILLDARRSPQPIDLSFIHWAGHAGIPICLVLTKADKLSKSGLHISKKKIEDTLLQTWEELPPVIVTSSVKDTGRDHIIAIIQDAIAGQN